MHNFLLISQTAVSVILIALILIQASSSSGLTGLSGQGGGENYHTRRGMEKVVYYATIVFLILFVVNSAALLMV